MKKEHIALICAAIAYNFAAKGDRKLIKYMQLPKSYDYYSLKSQAIKLLIETQKHEWSWDPCTDGFHRVLWFNTPLGYISFHVCSDTDNFLHLPEHIHDEFIGCNRATAYRLYNMYLKAYC